MIFREKDPNQQKLEKEVLSKIRNIIKDSEPIESNIGIKVNSVNFISPEEALNELLTLNKMTSGW